METAPTPNHSKANTSNQWESLNDFAGEKNINSKTGKERSFSEFDLYPKQPGETNEDYGARLRFMHQKTKEYQEAEAAREAESQYFASEQGQQELQAKAELDRITAKIERAAQEGRITEDHAKALLEKQSNKTTDIIDGARQDYEDRQAVGTPEEQVAYEEWLKSRSAEGTAEVEETEKEENLEEHNQTIELSAETKQWLEDELANIDDMLQHGRIDQAKADKYTAEVKNRAILKEEALRKAQSEQAATEKQTNEEKEQQSETNQQGYNNRERQDLEDVEDQERRELEDKERRQLEDQERRELENQERKKQAEEQLQKDEERKKEIEARLEEINKELGDEGQQKQTVEQLKKDEERKKEIEARLREINEELELSPLVAINADFTHDREELARDIAERQLNEEQTKANLIKRIWKGNLFKKYYQKKYEQELLAGERSAGVDEHGKNITLDNIINSRSGSAIRRFVLGATEDMRYIHSKIGQRNEDGTYDDGEKLVEADSETTAAVRTAIEKFAGAKIPEDGSMEDLKRKFSNDIKRVKAEARDQGREINDALIDNYFEVAMQARQRIEHGIAMDRVMEGFKVYNADVRNNMRTEAHRDSVDKIVNSLEKKSLGAIVPAEVLALAVGSALSLAQTGARSAARLAAPVGGIAVSSVLAGLRERNRVTEDRARMMRDAAVGLEYDGVSGQEVEGHRTKKRAKYEAKIGGTLYDLRPAGELISGIAQAMESGDSEAKLRAIAEARVRINYSDSMQKDLVSYTSADKMGDERMQLDIAVIRAENSLSQEEKRKLEAMKAAVDRKIDQDVDERDEGFHKVRATQALKQAGKTALIGSTVFLASQEIMAIIDPNKIGLFEKAGLIKTRNNDNGDIQDTVLASLFGPRVHAESNVETIEDISGDREVEIGVYEEAGYTKTETAAAWTETKKGLINVDPSKSDHSLRVELDYANNGTAYADGNELNLRLENGQYISDLRGSSTIGGRVLNYEQLAIEGRIRAHIEVGGGTFEVASKVTPEGNFAWPIDANGRVTSTSGDIIQAFDAEGHKLFDTFRVVADYGTDPNGVTHAVSLAADLGEGTFDGTIQQVSDIIIEHPAMYDFTKTTITEVPTEVFYGGIAATPASRTGLGGPTNTGGSMVVTGDIDNIPPEIIEEESF